VIDPELERGYNLRQAFPDYEKFFADWRARSAAARARLDCELDVAYGPKPRQKFDLFCARESHAPLLVFIHGGYWRAMDKSDFSFLAEPLVSLGVSVAMPSYSLCPDATIDEIVEDVRVAFTQLAARADRIHVCGWSAGAHLAAMLVAGGAPNIRSVLALSGIYDMRPLKHVSMNEDLRLDEAGAARNSPLLLKPKTQTRIAVAAGALETPALRKQSRDFAEAWQLGAQEIAGVHHYAIVSELGDERSALFATLLGQMRF